MSRGRDVSSSEAESGSGIDDGGESGMGASGCDDCWMMGLAGRGDERVGTRVEGSDCGRAEDE